MQTPQSDAFDAHTFRAWESFTGGIAEMLEEHGEGADTVERERIAGHVTRYLGEQLHGFGVYLKAVYLEGMIMQPSLDEIHEGVLASYLAKVVDVLEPRGDRIERELQERQLGEILDD